LFKQGTGSPARGRTGLLADGEVRVGEVARRCGYSVWAGGGRRGAGGANGNRTATL
jgi:hypothetical protein